MSLLAASVLLAVPPLDHTDISVGELLDEVGAAIGERLSASPEIAAERVFVLADSSWMRRIPEALPVLLDCAWERQVGGRRLVSRRGPMWNADQVRKQDKARLTRLIEATRSPGDQRGDEAAWAAAGASWCPWSDSAFLVLRAASAAQIASLLTGGMLTGSNVEDMADVTFRRTNPAQPDEFLVLRMDAWGGLSARRCRVGETQSASSHADLFESALEPHPNPRADTGDGERTQWELLERPALAYTEVETTQGPAFAASARNAATEAGMPVLGLASPLSCRKSSAIERMREMDGWLLCRPPHFQLTAQLRQALQRVANSFAVKHDATPMDEMQRLVGYGAFPGLISGFIDGRWHQVPDEHGVEAVWSALSQTEQALALSKGLDWRRLSPSVLQTLRRCFALQGGRLSPWEWCMALKELKAGAPLQIAVRRSAFATIRDGDSWKPLRGLKLGSELAQPGTELAQPGTELVVQGIVAVELRVGGFRSPKALAMTFMVSLHYQGPVGRAPDLSKFHPGNAG